MSVTSVEGVMSKVTDTRYMVKAAPGIPAGTAWVCPDCLTLYYVNGEGRGVYKPKCDCDVGFVLSELDQHPDNVCKRAAEIIRRLNLRNQKENTCRS